MKQAKQQFTAVYFKRPNWFIGWIEEIPGVNTQGKTLEETLNAVIRLSESISMQLNDIDNRLRAIESGAFQVAQSGIPIEIANPKQSTVRPQENTRLNVLNELKDLFSKRKSLNL